MSILKPPSRPSIEACQGWRLEFSKGGFTWETPPATGTPQQSLLNSIAGTGAYLLNWIWGIENNTFIALLMFVPLVNVVMAFVLGAKGSAWAWRNKRWDSVAVQDGPTEVGSLGGRRVRRVHLRLRRIVRLGNWPIDRITFEQDVSGHHLELGQ